MHRERRAAEVHHTLNAEDALPEEWPTVHPVGLQDCRRTMRARPERHGGAALAVGSLSCRTTDTSPEFAVHQVGQTCSIKKFDEEETNDLPVGALLFNP